MNFCTILVGRWASLHYLASELFALGHFAGAGTMQNDKLMTWTGGRRDMSHLLSSADESRSP